MVMNEGETWIWLADMGANHNMTNKRDDFVTYRRYLTGCGRRSSMLLLWELALSAAL
jgi:hypothetical protein